jgi:GxxExxY protein
LRYELERLNLEVKSELILPVEYDGVKLELGYRIDILVQDILIIELKSVSSLTPQHKAQLLTYLRLVKKDLGLLINFNTPTLKDGIMRVVNNHTPSRPRLD